MMTLIIVDCQVDFITGSLAVSGATEAIEAIKTYIKANKDNIDRIIFTMDWHPYKHCSFSINGGKWPVHCVHHTAGASIDFSLITLIDSLNIPYTVSMKGTEKNWEQYGAFTRTQLLLFKIKNPVVICGIAGDYCVKETIRNLISFGKIYPKVFLKGIASIDDGSVLKETIDKYKLETI